MKNSIMMFLMLSVIIYLSACEFGQKNLWESDIENSSVLYDGLAVQGMYPESNQLIDERDTAIIIFNRPISLDANSIYVTNDGMPYTCSISLDSSDTTTVIIQKSPQFDISDKYAIIITTRVKDTSGNHLNTPLTIPFKVNTNTPPPGNLSILKIIPDPSIPISKNASITIIFNMLMTTSLGTLLVQQIDENGVVTTYTCNTRWLQNSDGKGNSYKFRPINPHNFTPGLPVVVTLNDFQSAAGSLLPAGTTRTFSVKAD